MRVYFNIIKVNKLEKNCTVIVNPTAGRGRSTRYLPMLSDVLKEKYENITIKTTKKTKDATRFARIAAKNNEDIICMGGDGTINETINGIVPVKNSTSTFGFAPFGTVNDLARALHIPRSPKGAIRMLKNATKTKIDVGKINKRYFINVVAAGLIAETVGKVTIKEKTLFGSMAYFIKALQVINKQPSYRFRIEMKNGTIIQISSPLIAAMLTDSAGSFHNFMPTKDRNKGVIKLVLFKDFSWINTLKEAPKLITGEQFGPDTMTVIDVKKAHISIEDENTELLTNIDGEIGSEFPINIEVLPSRLSVFIPNNAEKENSTFNVPHLIEFLRKHLKLTYTE